MSKTAPASLIKNIIKGTVSFELGEKNYRVSNVVLLTALALLSSLVIYAFTLKHGQNLAGSVNFAEEVAKSEKVFSADEKKINIVQQIQEVYTIKRGDTLDSIMRKFKIASSDRKEIAKLANKHKLSSRLRIGNKIQLNATSNIDDTFNKLQKLTINVDKLSSYRFIKNENNKYSFDKYTVPTKTALVKYDAKIDSSVTEALRKAGMPIASINRLIQAMSFEFDFQRDIRTGDQISVVAENIITENGDFVTCGEIIHAKLNTGNKVLDVYQYSPKGKGKAKQFFKANGVSIKNSLLRTPVKATRISGKYGYRKKHPVHGYGRMHKGVDFAAPTGTPICASGKGVVKFIGWKGGYGRVVEIKHNGTLSTLYAHASRFNKKLKRGSKVKQGQVIAYVGRSGTATGPHLHYEVKINGKQVNPMKFKPVPEIKLAGNDLRKFKAFKMEVNGLRQKLDTGVMIASNEIIKNNINKNSALQNKKVS